MEDDDDNTAAWAHQAVATLLWWCLREVDFERERWALQLGRER